jgi:hypothetical protein
VSTSFVRVFVYPCASWNHVWQWRVIPSDLNGRETRDWSRIANLSDLVVTIYTKNRRKLFRRRQQVENGILEEEGRE